MYQASKFSGLTVDGIMSHEVAALGVVPLEARNR